MTTSTGMFGLRGNLAYAAAKAGVVGLTRNMKLSGADTGSGQLSRAGRGDPHGRRRRLRPRRGRCRTWRPISSRRWSRYLCHEDCPVSGEIYAAGGGRFARIFIAATEGYVQPDGDCRRPRTSPSTGRRSTTRPATTSPSTSTPGPPSS